MLIPSNHRISPLWYCKRNASAHARSQISFQTLHAHNGAQTTYTQSRINFARLYGCRRRVIHAEFKNRIFRQ